MVSYLAVFVLITTAISNGLAQGPLQYTWTREIAPPRCEFDPILNTVRIVFIAQLNTDPINWISGCAFNATSQSYYMTNCTFDDFTENGIRYLMTETLVNLTEATHEAAVNPCGFEVIDSDPTTFAIKMRLALRRMLGYLFYGDADYIFTCKLRNSINTWTSTSVEVTYNELVNPVDPQVPNVVLAVVDDNKDPITSCNVTDQIALRLTLENLVTYKDNLVPHGLNAFDTMLARFYQHLTNPAQRYPLVGTDGCPVANNYQTLADGFKVDLANSHGQMVYYYTSYFQCKRFFTSNQLWFSTRFSTCTGLWSSLTDPEHRCTDFCAYSNRKRRAVHDIVEEEIYAVVSVHGAPEEQPEEKEAEGLSDTVMIAIVVAAVGLVVALLVVFCCFLWFVLRQQRSTRTKSGSYPVDDSSRASSERKLPIKF